MRFTDDVNRVNDALRAYTTAGVVAGVAVPAALTAVPALVLAAMPTAPRPDLGVAPGGWAAWLLVAAHLPTVVSVRDALRARDEARFRRTFFLQSQVQLLWLFTVVWQVAPYAPQLSIGVLFGMMLGWAFQDAQLSHGAWFVRAQYLVAPALFDLGLLALDLAGGRGLSYAFTVDRRFAVAFVVNQCILVGLTQMVLLTMGRIAREREEAQARAVSLRLEHERLGLEHKLLRRIAGLLASGVSAGQLSHDFASPLAVLLANLEYLDQTAQARPDARDDEAREALAEMRAAVEQMQTLSYATSLAIRDGGALTEVPVERLVDDAEAIARRTLLEHPDAPLTLARDLDPSVVRVTPVHAQAIANVVVNGVLHQARGARIELMGRARDARYELRIRDFGTPSERREEVLARIRASVSLLGEPATKARGGEYRGFGIGLLLARTLVVSTGGAFDVVAPPDGAGVVVVITLSSVEGATRDALPRESV